MKKYFHVPARYLACFMALSMVCTSAPATVYAQEDVLAGESVSGDEAQDSRTLVITKFTVKNEEKYENLAAPQGTELNQLGLPDVITVEGYLESDGADAPQGATDLEKMVWKLDNDETYSPETPAGTYKFTPDFKKYAEAQIEAGTALYEEFRLADDMKPLTIEVVIEEPATEPMETEPMATEPAETEPLETESMATEPMETEPTATEPMVTESMVMESTETEPIVTEPAETEPVATEPPASEEDIFSGMDESLIGADGSDVWFSDQPENETDAPAQEPEQLISTDLGYGIGTIEETSPAPAVQPSPEPQAAPEISVIITLTDGTHSASFPADTNVSAPYKLAGNPTADGSAATNPTLLLENLPCGMDLSKVAVTVKAADDSVALTVDQASVDFASASTQNLILTSGGAVSYTYPLSLTVTKADHAWTAATCTTPAACTVCGATGSLAEHTWADATCTAPKTCTVCGATEGEKLPHTWKEATCTTPKTCTVCGATEGEKLGHNWKKATCTEPQTCKRCGKTKGEKLGHNWLEATCTEPKTCKRCNATKGKALGHDLRDDWQTVEKSTDTKHGLEERLCHRKGCDYTEERDLNIIGAPENNGISGVTANANYELNAIISFTASGSGMSNSEPIDGDVRYVPLSWSVQGTPGSFRDNYAGGFSVTQAGTYTLSVTYQKQSYQGSWQSTNETDSKSVSFTVGSASADPSATTPTDGGVHINPQTGDSTPIAGLVAALIAAVSLIAAMLVYKKKRQNHRA